jgi:hypothetical protein
MKIINKELAYCRGWDDFGPCWKVMFYPEGAECFSLSELKAIVEEMEKMEKTNG